MQHLSRRPFLAVLALALPALSLSARADEAPFAPVPADQVVEADLLFLRRPVIVFADSPHDPAFIRQMDLLARAYDALAARDGILITDTDPANAAAANPMIQVVKKINGQDANDATTAVPTVAGATMTVTFEVENTGNTTLIGVTVTDDVIPAGAISCPDSVLDVGECVFEAGDQTGIGIDAAHAGITTGMQMRIGDMQDAQRAMDHLLLIRALTDRERSRQRLSRQPVADDEPVSHCRQGAATGHG